MKKYLQSTTFTTGLAIFAMLFGAGNLIFPMKLGITSGDLTHIGLLGFMISGVLLPLAGLIGMVFYDGDYRAFFYRTGVIPGAVLIFFCMLIIGPLFVMPRIIALTYKLMVPFMPAISRFTFSIIFGSLTFLCCYRRNRIVDLLGKILSPIKLLTLFTIMAIGFWFARPLLHCTTPAWTVFATHFKEGYKTLDLMGAIFFAYIIISILKRTLDAKTASNQKEIARIMTYGGLIGGGLLAIVYVGMAYLGAMHGQGLEQLGTGEMFIETIRRVMGDHGALFISITILVACLSTMIALATVVSEYLRTELFHGHLTYIHTLIPVLILTSCIARYDLDTLLAFYVPIMEVSYPVLIVLTLCNISHKLFGTKMVKLPVLLTFIIMTIWTGYDFFKPVTTPVDVIEAEVTSI